MEVLRRLFKRARSPERFEGGFLSDPFNLPLPGWRACRRILNQGPGPSAQVADRQSRGRRLVEGRANLSLGGPAICFEKHCFNQSNLATPGDVEISILAQTHTFSLRNRSFSVLGHSFLSIHAVSITKQRFGSAGPAASHPASSSHCAYQSSLIGASLH